MMLRILVLFLFVSCALAISTSDFHTFFTSESRGLNHSNGQTQEFLERLNGSIRDKTRLDEKVEERKNELPDTLRTGRRGRGGASGGANINRRPRPTRRSAASLLEVPRFWVSTLTPFLVSLALIFIFPLN